MQVYTVPMFAACHLQQGLLPESLQQKKWVNYLVELDHGLHLLLIIRTAFGHLNDDVNGGNFKIIPSTSSLLKLIILSHPKEHSNQLSLFRQARVTYNLIF
jgi:hypothetical protein